MSSTLRDVGKGGKVRSSAVEGGRLEQEPTSALCRRFGEESRTGCLHLTGNVDGERPEARLYLREGRVYTARALTSRTRLGDRLVGGGHLTAEQLEVALVSQKRRSVPMRLGDVLVASGMVSRDVLRRVVRDQIVDSVAVALGWRAGAWQFLDGETVPEDVPLGLGMQDTLMEAARRLGQLEVIRAHLGGMDTVVDFASDGKDAMLSLRPDEWAMVTHIDGSTSVAEIAERSGYGQLEAARIIYGLLSAGVVVRLQTATDALPTRPVASSDEDGATSGGADGAADGAGSAAGSAPAAADTDYLADLEWFGERARPKPATPVGEPAPAERSAAYSGALFAEVGDEGDAQNTPQFRDMLQPRKPPARKKKGFLDRFRRG